MSWPPPRAPGTPGPRSCLYLTANQLHRMLAPPWQTGRCSARARAVFFVESMVVSLLVIRSSNADG